MVIREYKTQARISLDAEMQQSSVYEALIILSHMFCIGLQLQWLHVCTPGLHTFSNSLISAYG